MIPFLFALIFLTVLLPSCKSKPETVVNIEGYRAKAVELCEDHLDGPGYVILFLDQNSQLSTVSIVLPGFSQYGTIHSIAYSDFKIDSDKTYTMPLSFNNRFEKWKSLDGIMVTQGLYGEYVLFEDGRLEYIGGIEEERLPPEDRIDSEKFNADILWNKYGIDIGKIKNSAVTKVYSEQNTQS